MLGFARNKGHAMISHHCIFYLEFNSCKMFSIRYIRNWIEVVCHSGAT